MLGNVGDIERHRHGLQIRAPRFDSGRGLKVFLDKSVIPTRQSRHLRQLRRDISWDSGVVMCSHRDELRHEAR